MSLLISSENKPQLLSVSQMTLEGVNALFHYADILKPVASRKKVCRVLEGAVLANLFFEASTRTRISFGAAFCRLGGAVCDTTGFTSSSMAKGESIADTSRVISGYVDAIVLRHPEKGAVAEFARATNLPVINGGDGPGEHPSQALLDLYTIIKELSRSGKDINGSHIALVGDLKYGRTVHSLIKLLSLYKGLKFTLISPKNLQMPSYILDEVSNGDNIIEQFSVLDKNVHDIDIVYATRIQKERFSAGEEDNYSPELQLNKSFIDRFCKSSVIVMHPLPRDSRAEAFDLSTDLDNDPRLAIFRQTDNGIPIRMALFAVLMGVESKIHGSLRDTTWKAPNFTGPNDHFTLHE
ncbi:aspartate carbamoyltransferase [Pseudomonas amygdali]|uniref:aspartate carbamoyltransferase n=1 Tax=Pseudomonas amygdali TaxID=47877 RepID=UPI000CD060C8|nr:aspartate carbamoyltransferase [Pseudomonas amygdali]POC98228.1 aspartate carbamoyltransferase [Pseudomonas amygdali pv. morsprunorum]POD37357.1 aspartate carbamoyltransferase [Pseudomonas amygdali pv. morsprunorum]POD39071.1 aspartate carbamoyltransferase [Pseudomonas amygdali pv. morsprunorum]